MMIGFPLEGENLDWDREDRILSQLLFDAELILAKEITQRDHSEVKKSQEMPPYQDQITKVLIDAIGE